MLPLLCGIGVVLLVGCLVIVFQSPKQRQYRYGRYRKDFSALSGMIALLLILVLLFPIVVILVLMYLLSLLVEKFISLFIRKSRRPSHKPSWLAKRRQRWHIQRERRLAIAVALDLAQQEIPDA